MVDFLRKHSTSFGSWADRFSSTWTFLFLLTLAVIVAVRHHLGPNAVCISPALFTKEHSAFVNEHCWMAREFIDAPGQNYMAYITRSPPDEGEKDTRTLYQWLSLILVCQALLFRLPDIVLHVGESSFGMGCQKIQGMVKGYTSHTAQERLIIAKDIADYIRHTVGGTYIGVITIVIAFVKLLYFVNAVTQLTVLEGYVAPPNVTSYGQYVLESIINSNYSYVGYSPAFPRDVLCDVTLRHVTSVHLYTVQCVLQVNEFNEKVCFLVWIWLLVACVASGTSGLMFLGKSLLPMIQPRYVKKYLSMANLKPSVHELNILSNSSIGQDGIFVLKVIGDISSNMLVRDIVVSLWNNIKAPAPINDTQTPPYPQTSSYIALSQNGEGGERIASKPEKNH